MSCIPAFRLTETGFDQEWAQKSVKLLCYQKRKVFYGNNLFAKGACAAGAERFLTHKLKDYRYLGSALVTNECRNGYAYYGCTGVLSADRSRKKLV